MLDVTAKLAFIRQLNLLGDLLSMTGKAWVEQIVRRVAGEKADETRAQASRKTLA
jgi:hypothetical protein